MKLVIFNDNWADEMDIDGFVLMKDEEWKDSRKKISNCKKKISVSFGSNEWNEYGDGKHLLSKIKAKTITEEEAIVIKKFFGKEYGQVGFAWDLDDLGEE